MIKESEREREREREGRRINTVLLCYSGVPWDHLTRLVGPGWLCVNVSVMPSLSLLAAVCQWSEAEGRGPALTSQAQHYNVLLLPGSAR